MSNGKRRNLWQESDHKRLRFIRRALSVVKMMRCTLNDHDHGPQHGTDHHRQNDEKLSIWFSRRNSLVPLRMIKVDHIKLMKRMRRSSAKVHHHSTFHSTTSRRPPRSIRYIVHHLQVLKRLPLVSHTTIVSQRSFHHVDGLNFT